MHIPHLTLVMQDILCYTHAYTLTGKNFHTHTYMCTHRHTHTMRKSTGPDWDVIFRAGTLISSLTFFVILVLNIPVTRSQSIPSLLISLSLANSLSFLLSVSLCFSLARALGPPSRSLSLSLSLTLSYFPPFIREVKRCKKEVTRK